MNSNSNTAKLSEGAVMVAVSIALMFLKVKFLPDGGSVDLVMIPLLVYSLRRGAGWGVAASAVFGTLKCILSGGIAYGWQALILDYSVAYAVLGVAGLLPEHPVTAAIIAGTVRYAVHVVSGVVVWGSWMPDNFLGLNMTNIWVYSLLYNATYMLPCTIIAAAAIHFLTKRTELLQTSA